MLSAIALLANALQTNRDKPLVGVLFASTVCGSARIGSADGLGSRPATVAYGAESHTEVAAATAIIATVIAIGGAMWNFESKHNALQERMVLVAPEANPHEFVRSYLQARARSRPALQRPDIYQPDIYELDRRQLARPQQPAA